MAAALLLYTFAGYPALLLFVARWRNRAHTRAPIQPEVSIIIAAHNEESLISAKIVNCLELDYPQERREIIVASDASTDATVARARAFEAQGVRVIDLVERGGKQNAQLQGIQVARGEILVFTDAGTQLPPGALREIVSNFADPSIGCVSSEDRLIQESRGWIGERSYLRLEMWMRRMESLAGSIVTASGSFFAARRRVCETWPVDQTSDFFVPLNTVALGMRAVVDPASVGRYSAARTESAELRRKVRTVVIGLYVFFSHRSLLNPFRHGLTTWQLISHKLCRWLTPFAALALLLSSLALWNTGVFYRLCAVLLVAAVAAGILGLAAGRLTEWKPLRLAGYLLLGNAATVMAWSYYILGEKFVTWQPTRRG